jgi:hypothetical protein
MQFLRGLTSLAGKFSARGGSYILSELEAHMKRLSVLLATGTLFLFVGMFIGPRGSSVVHAQQTTFGSKAWGTCKGATPTGQLIFEDGIGTVRLVSSGGQVALVMTRN